MRDYAKVPISFWTRGLGRKFRGDADAVLVALYFMAGPASSMLGLYYLALPTLFHETGLSPERARGAMDRLIDSGEVFYDEDAELVFVREGAAEQIAEGLAPTDNRVKGVSKALAAFRGHPFHQAFLERYAGPFHLPIEPGATPFEAPSKPLRSPTVGASEQGQSPQEGGTEGLRSQDQNQDQEQNQKQLERAREREGTRAPKLDYGADVDAVVDRLNSHPVLVPIATPEVAMTLLARVTAGALDVPDVLAAIDRAAAKEAPRAAVDGPYPTGKLAAFVGTTVGWATRSPSALVEQSEATSAFEAWCRTYAKSVRRYGTYTPAPEVDEREARKLVTAAIAVAEPRAAESGESTVEIARRVLAHWFREYLRDDGDRDYLVTQRHPLRLLGRGIPKYGTPWSVPSPRAALDVPEAPAPTAEDLAQNAASAREAAALLSTFGKGPTIAGAAPAPARAKRRVG